MKRTVVASLLMSLCLIMSMSASVSALTVSYNDFSDLSGFSLNASTASINAGGPVIYNGQPVLRLTNSLSQGGSAFLTDSIHLADETSFSAFFSFQITDPQGWSDIDGQGADGITFTVQTASNTAGGAGGGIGYAGIPNSLGIEFDTWNNGGVDGYSGNHVGINLNGSMNSVARANVLQRMNDGDVWYSWVDYNGASDLLEVRLSLMANRPDDVLLSYNVDLLSVLATPYAYIGFTSGTGAAGGDHDIRSFQFNNTYDPIDPNQPVPEPSTIALLSIGLVGIAGAGQRLKR